MLRCAGAKGKAAKGGAKAGPAAATGGAGKGKNAKGQAGGDSDGQSSALSVEAIAARLAEWQPEIEGCGEDGELAQVG